MNSANIETGTATAPIMPALTRTVPAPPVRIVHLGLGAFSRSHLAWYTSLADDAQEWGIAAYTGRSTALVESLTAQDGLYTLVERSPSGDRVEVVSSIARAHSGQDVERLLSDLQLPDLAIVSLTITEAAYACTAQGVLDTMNPSVVDDMNLLGSANTHGEAAMRLQTVVARLVWGLNARRHLGLSGLALMSCDNIPDNGAMLRNVVLGMATAIPGLSEWCIDNVRFVPTSVDRITPRVSDEELGTLARSLGDFAPVVAEPFSDWVIEGEFPAGRPAWETAGARFTDDLGPWEARKLWTLNGAHTILAAIGRHVGHATVHQAASDLRCWNLVSAFWDEVAANLPDFVESCAYQEAVKDRFLNDRIEHSLEQIGINSTLKVSLRIAPVAERERRAGRSARACAAAIAAWMLAEGQEDARAGVAAVSTELAEDDEFIGTVANARKQLLGASSLPPEKLTSSLDSL